MASMRTSSVIGLFSCDARTTHSTLVEIRHSTGYAWKTGFRPLHDPRPVPVPRRNPRRRSAMSIFTASRTWSRRAEDDGW